MLVSRTAQYVAAGLRCLDTRSMPAMSGEPANFSLEDAARWRANRPRGKWRDDQRPTLGDLQRSSPWVWLLLRALPAPRTIRLCCRGDPLEAERFRRSAAPANSLHSLRI